ncbi:MAG: hypothetical protein DRI37_04540 [Chloroflexi bacterium]|nr:MAG: hypothetical protein DRI37_04540 [Chloroflexota bacterium]
MKNKENPVISYFHGGIKNTDRVISVAFSKMIEQVKSNKNWEKKILHVRLVLNKYGKGTEYKEAKRQLHYFMPCGSFKKRSKQGLEAVNGLLQGDIDNLTPEELERARQLLIKDQHTLGLFTSPSGLGLKFFIRINNQNNNALPVQAVLHYYKSNYDLELDPSTLNLYQACYISFDPEALINLSANIFTYELEDKKDRLHGGRAINNSSSNNQQSLNYCKMVITLEARKY